MSTIGFDEPDGSPCIWSGNCLTLGRSDKINCYCQCHECAVRKNLAAQSAAFPIRILSCHRRVMCLRHAVAVFYSATWIRVHQLGKLVSSFSIKTLFCWHNACVLSSVLRRFVKTPRLLLQNSWLVVTILESLIPKMRDATLSLLSILSCISMSEPLPLASFVSSFAGHFSCDAVTLLLPCGRSQGVARLAKELRYQLYLWKGWKLCEILKMVTKIYIPSILATQYFQRQCSANFNRI